MRVEGYTKKDGTVVQGYERDGGKKAQPESSPRLSRGSDESDFQYLLRLDEIAEGIPVEGGYYSMSNAMEEAGLDPDASDTGDAEVADAIKQWIEKQQGASDAGNGSGLLSSIGNPEPLTIRNEFADRDLHKRLKKKFSEQTGLGNDSELAKLAGLTDTSNVKIRYSDTALDRDAPRGTMAAVVSARNGATSVRQVYRGGDGGLRIYNYVMEVKKGKRGQGMGSALLARQVQNAVDSGVVEMKCEAVRADGPKGEIGGSMSGYYVWPLLGYDGRAPRIHHPDPRTQRSLNVPADKVNEFREAVSHLPDSAKNATKVSDFYKTTEGQQFWRKWGNTINLSFDLREGSDSLKKLSVYLEERGKK